MLVFVSSRRQTRLTALDVIAFAAADERPDQFVHMSKDELEASLATVRVRPKALSTLHRKPLVCNDSSPEHPTTFSTRKAAYS